MAILPPWTPPVGNTWTTLELYTRAMQGVALTFGEGDQNKTSAEDAINWIGNKIVDILNQIAATNPTGDLRMSYSPNPGAGWLLLDGRTIGSATSGSVLTGVTYQPLYDVLWTYATNSDLLSSAGASTTKGASSTADWAANKRLILPDARGRVIVAAGAGAGLTNRIIMSRFGGEGGSLNHSHSVDITSSNSLATYQPTGNITVDSVVLSTTPVGSVSVDNYSGSIVPVGSVSVATAAPSYTPAGIVSVTLTNNVLLNDADTLNVDGITCVDVAAGIPGEESVIDCSSALTIDLDILASNLTTNVTVASATFTGTPATISHTHTATFTGSSVSINHGHSASFTGVTADLSHSHTGSFTGDPVDFEHNHNVSGSTGTATLSYSTIQPSLAAYIYIKL
jgi:hypothetical protein